MSRYNDDGYDDPRSYHTVHTRQREPGEPDYVREETYIQRGKGPGPAPRDLVYRGREDSIEDIDREFPPPNARDYRGYDDRGPRRARSARGRYDDDDDYDDRDRYTDYGAAGAGAAAGYAAGRRSGDRRRRRHRDRSRDSDYSDASPRRSPERRKSGVGELLGGLGLGGLAAAVTGKSKEKERERRDDDRSVRSRSRPAMSRAGRSYRSEGERSRSRDKLDKTGKKWTQAAQAAIIAGAVEAFRSRKEAGPWTGEKGKRIATAAIGAGGIDRLIDRNPDEKSKRHLAEAVLGGLVANRLANGARSKSRGPNDRSGSPDTYASSRRARSRSIVDRFRGRSQSRGPDGELRQGNGGNGIKELVAGGALAAAGKALYDRVRSKSRNRRERSRSSSRDSYVPSRARQRDTRRKRRSPNGSVDIAAAGATRQMTRRGTDRDRAIRDTDRDGNKDRAIAAGAGGGAAAIGEGSKDGEENKNDSSSSTTSMENKRKKMKGKELITAGLASVATIHAVHGVYSSMEAHQKRHRLVAEGEMTPEEAKKRQTKAWVQDAAAIGIAALGIKGAFSEWKEMNEHRHEIQELEKRKREKRKRIKQRKAKEEAEHRERIMSLMEQNPQGAMLMMQHDYVNGYNNMNPAKYPGYQAPMAPPPVEQSGNPYAPRSRN